MKNYHVKKIWGPLVTSVVLLAASYVSLKAQGRPPAGTKEMAEQIQALQDAGFKMDDKAIEKLNQSSITVDRNAIELLKKATGQPLPQKYSLLDAVKESKRLQMIEAKAHEFGERFARIDKADKEQVMAFEKDLSETFAKLNAISIVSVKTTRGPGARIFYQSMADRIKQTDPKRFGQLSDTSEKLNYGYYYIWSMRGDVRTSDDNARFDILSDAEKIDLEEK